WRMELNHYLDTLKKKPGAFAGSAAWQQAPQKMRTLYENYYNRREKELIQLLQYIQGNVTFAEIGMAVEELARIHPNHVTTDKIKVLCARNREMKTLTQTTPSEAGQEIVDRSMEQLRGYDDLLSDVK